MQEGQISVWVCREEKLVLGLTKRTSCADVVQVLLEEQDAAAATAPAYCIVEKWRGFERVLPNKTKIYRLWQAWGDEQKNVQFVLLKSEASLANRGARSAEARVVLSKRSPTGGGGPATRALAPAAAAATAGISPEKQRRIVRKAFRKLERMNKRKRAAEVHRDAERMETLVHVVVSQDLTLRQQLQRIDELDAEIERCEADVHRDRVKRHGVNYVQDTYLVDGERRRSGGGSGDACVKLEEVARLQEELREQEALIDALTAQIQEELNLRWMLRREEEEEGVQGSGATDLDLAAAAAENELVLEGERVRTQLDASLYIGLRLNSDLETIGSELELSRRLCADREREVRDLEERVESLELEEGVGMKSVTMRRRMSGEQQGKSEWVEQARGLSTAQDDDSDTGLSSLHSQDSDCQTVWESLV